MKPHRGKDAANHSGTHPPGKPQSVAHDALHSYVRGTTDMIIAIRYV